MTSIRRAQLRPWRSLSLFAALTMVAALLPAAALAHDPPSTAGTISTAFEQPTVTAQGTQTLSLDVTPTEHALRWIGIIAPSGYQIEGVSANGSTLTDFNGQRAIVDVHGAVGTATAVALTVTPPNACTTSADAWSVYAETETAEEHPDRLGLTKFPDENEVNHLPLDEDDFTPYPDHPQTTVQNDCRLAFDSQPTTTVKNASITDAPLSAGGPVAVKVTDAEGNLVEISGANVSLDAPGGPSSLAGTNSATTSAGVASFPGISLALADTYTLAASASPMVGAMSDAFQIVDAGTACAEGSGCSTSANGGGGSTGLDVTGGSSTGAGILTIAFTGALSCTSPYLGKPYPATSATFTVDLTTDATKIFDLTISRAAARAAHKPFAFQYHVCYNSPNAFRQLYGAPAGADAANGGYTGLLPGCLTVWTDDLPGQPRANSGPCVIWKYNDFRGNIHIRFFAPAGDPRGYS